MKYFIFALIIIANPLFANCDFKTGDFINEINDPQSLRKISINIPKSASWQKNFLRIIVKRSKNIPPNLRKKYFANITAHYDFGECSFNGKVWQNGDWKDHIEFANGKPLRSINVKLDEGNIVNSTRFKLLIPATRNDFNEIFAVSILRASGFLTPETFKVQTDVNGTRSIMLFQEDARKELLERNDRREGPMFEGDESLLWADGRINNDYISLARLLNDKWVMRGVDSVKMSLRAAKALQIAYVYRANNINFYGNFLDPNNFVDFETNSSEKFSSYHFILQSLGAEHALIPHNRKFYFNALENIFEPIYYDGNVFQDRHTSFEKATIQHSYRGFDVTQYSEKILSQEIKSTAKSIFVSRVRLNATEANRTFEKLWTRLSENVFELKDLILKLENRDWPIDPYQDERNIFLNNLYLHDTRTKVVNNINFNDRRSTFTALFNGEQQELNFGEVSKILSDNSLADRRTIFLPNELHNFSSKVKQTRLDNGLILSSPGVKIDLHFEERRIDIWQRSPNDWILIKDAVLDNWLVTFNGKEGFIEAPAQRFNEFGLTGCLTFISSVFKSTQIKVSHGTCEDSINLIASSGIIKNLSVSNAAFDAVDLDFSEIIVEDIYVSHAGNDCVDVSSGHYTILQASVSDCGDKGLSVGEKSELIAQYVSVERADIAVSSKDFSIVHIEELDGKSTRNCFEAFQKKQEFGGARMVIENTNCLNPSNVDASSSLIINSDVF